MTPAARFAPTRLARTFAAMLGGQVGGRAIRLAYVVVLARLLDTAELGLYLYGIAVYIALLGLAGFGQGLFLAVRLPQRTAVRRWFAHSLTIRLAATGLAALIGLASVWVLESEAAIRMTVSLFIGALVVRSLAAWVREAHVALEDAAWIPRFEAGFRLGEAAVGIALVAAGFGVVWIAALHVAVWAMEAGASVRLMARRGRWPARMGQDWRLLRPMALASFWHMVGVGLIIVFGQGAVVGLKQLDASSAVVGQFGIAAQAMLALLLIPTTLAAALVPALSRVRRRGSAEDQRAVTALMRWTLAVGAAMAVLVNGYGTPVVAWVLGPRYAEASIFLDTLAWAAGPHAAAIIAVQALNALGRRRGAAAVSTVMVAALIAALVGFYPLVGPQAACAAVVAGAFLGCAVGAPMVGRASGVPGTRWWLLPLLLTAAAAGLTRVLPLTALVLAPVLLALLLAAFVATRTIGRDELVYIARRFRRSSDIAADRAS